MKLKLVLITCLISILSFGGILSAKDVKVINKPTIVIDPGHGGVDPGTIVNNVLEKDLNLSIALKLASILKKDGYNVLLTREGDYDLSSPDAEYRKKSDFDNRISLINLKKNKLYISIHINYLNDSNYYGPQVFYVDDNKNIAKIMQNELNKSLGTDRKIKKLQSNIYMYNKINIPGLLIECGFLSNEQERQKLINEDYQKELSKAIFKGILMIINKK